MNEKEIFERYINSRNAGVGRALSAYIALQTTTLSFHKLDIVIDQREVYMNAGLVENLDPANILVPGI